ncbi:GNAT family N-acetyltransferase [Luteimonas sp. FCS-9]|uniref:GNAT family N-acetyltransferase n=1 Tax=Luteimonas sp. FCS-9 TaxID=1547516 RepID=UPI0006998289|nr:GNAT family N-acetyltransferase [Luteimonas sp. FCS-9]
MPEHDALSPSLPEEALPQFSKADLPTDGRDYPAEVQLRSRRLQLRGFGFRHVLELLQLGREERVTRLLLDNRLDTLEDAMGLVVWANRIYRERPGLGLWRAADRSDRFIGMFSLVPLGTTMDVSIGVRLLPSAWGRGYAIEGGAALCTHAFETLGLADLVAHCAPDNRSVPPLLLRLGFGEIERGEQFGRPARRFRLARADWRGLRPRREMHPESTTRDGPAPTTGA